MEPRGTSRFVPSISVYIDMDAHTELMQECRIVSLKISFTKGTYYQKGLGSLLTYGEYLCVYCVSWF